MPADDAPTFLHAAAAIVSPIAPAALRADRQAYEIVFTTLDHSDAISAGFERAEFELGEDGGYSVSFDGRGSVPAVELVLADNRIVGLHAIVEARRALEACERKALRMAGRAS